MLNLGRDGGRRLLDRERLRSFELKLLLLILRAIFRRVRSARGLQRDLRRVSVLVKTRCMVLPNRLLGSLRPLICPSSRELLRGRMPAGEACNSDASKKDSSRGGKTTECNGGLLGAAARSRQTLTVRHKTCSRAPNHIHLHPQLTLQRAPAPSPGREVTERPAFRSRVVGYDILGFF